MISPHQTAASFSQEPSGGTASGDHPQAMPPGSVVGDYEVVRVLGQGGFGIVYLAKDRVLDRQVAIKEFLPVTLAARSQDLQVQARSPAAERRFTAGLRAFVQEARLLAKFDHPALVNIHRFWEGNGTAYMVMPYYEGRTLLEARKAMERPPPEEWLRSALVALLGGLELVHKASFVHRDISPENILVLDDGRAVLLDFAVLPSEAGDDSGENTTILKPAWAPIEQFANTRSLPQGPWTDIYSLGAVAYFCVTGKAPPAATVRVVGETGPSTPLAEALPRLMAAYPGLNYNPFLVSAIDWALSVRPSDRPQSAQEWSKALMKLKAGPATVSPISPGIRIEFPDSQHQMPPPQGLGGDRPAVRPVASSEPPSAASMGGAQGSQQQPKTRIDSSIRDAIGAALSGFESMGPSGSGGAAPNHPPPPSSQFSPDLVGLGDAAASVAPAAARQEPRLAPVTSPLSSGSGRGRGTSSSGRRSVGRHMPSRGGAVQGATTMSKWWVGAGAALVLVGAWLFLRGGEDAEDVAEAHPASSAAHPAPTAQPQASGGGQQSRTQPASASASTPSSLLPPLVDPSTGAKDKSLPGGGQQQSQAASTAPGATAASQSKSGTGDAASSSVGAEPSSLDSRVEEALRQAEAIHKGGGSSAASAAPAQKKSPPPPPQPQAATEPPAQKKKPTAPPAAKAPAEEEELPPEGGEKPGGSAGAASPSSPRAACGSKTNFSLLRCMQTQCQSSRFVLHPQCTRLRQTGEVD